VAIYNLQSAVCSLQSLLYDSAESMGVSDSAVGPYFVLRLLVLRLDARSEFEPTVESVLMYLRRVLHRLSTYATVSKSADFEFESPDCEKKSADFELSRWGVTEPIQYSTVLEVLISNIRVLVVASSTSTR
jgi:hypothetical protein